MYNVSFQLYHKLAELLLEEVSECGYYNDSIEFCHEGIDCQLLLSAVIYHRIVEAPDYRTEIISDIVPVWWEFHTYTEDGEILNTFSFNELRTFIKP